MDLFACLFGGSVRFSVSFLPLYHFLGCWEKGVEVSNCSHVVLYFSFELYQFLLYSLSDMKLYIKVNVYYFSYFVLLSFN